nr:putative mitochondrial protein [Tanacetum cinerariifolium]
MTDTERLPLRHGKGPSHRKDSNLSAEKGKGRSKQKERKAHHIGQRHQQLKKLTAGFKQKMGEPEKERKPAISDLGWPFTLSHKSSSYFTTYVGSVLQGLLELSSTCSWLDRSVSGQIGRTRRFHLWKAPTPNGLSCCSHFLTDPSCKRCTFSRREEGKLSSRSLLVFLSSRKRMKPGKKEMNTLLRNEASSLFFFKAPIHSRSPLLTGSRLISLPLATQKFQFAKFEKSKERRLATELGYGFSIEDPWITDGISPWPFASESVFPSQCPGIHPMHSFRSCTHGAIMSLEAHVDLIEDIALERDTKSLPKIEREAIPVRYCVPLRGYKIEKNALDGCPGIEKSTETPEEYDRCEALFYAGLSWKSPGYISSKGAELEERSELR